MDLLVISDFFISSFGLSIFILSRLYAPACLLRLHTTFHVIRCIRCITCGTDRSAQYALPRPCSKCSGAHQTGYDYSITAMDDDRGARILAPGHSLVTGLSSSLLPIA
jgi:hypothetical protein